MIYCPVEHCQPEQGKKVCLRTSSQDAIPLRGRWGGLQGLWPQEWRLGRFPQLSQGVFCREVKPPFSLAKMTGELTTLMFFWKKSQKGGREGQRGHLNDSHRTFCYCQIPRPQPESSPGPLKLELAGPLLPSEMTLCFSSREQGTQSPVTHYHSSVAYTAHTSRSKVASVPCPLPLCRPPPSWGQKPWGNVHSSTNLQLLPPLKQSMTQRIEFSTSHPPIVEMLLCSPQQLPPALSCVIKD